MRIIKIKGTPPKRVSFLEIIKYASIQKAVIPVKIDNVELSSKAVIPKYNIVDSHTTAQSILKCFKGILLFNARHFLNSPISERINHLIEDIA